MTNGWRRLNHFLLYSLWQQSSKCDAMRFEGSVDLLSGLALLHSSRVAVWAREGGGKVIYLSVGLDWAGVVALVALEGRPFFRVGAQSVLIQLLFQRGGEVTQAAPERVLPGVRTDYVALETVIEQKIRVVSSN